MSVFLDKYVGEMRTIFKDNPIVFFLFGIIDMIIVQSAFINIIQCLVHMAFFFAVVVPIVFWDASITNLFTFDSWCSEFNGHLQRYYRLGYFLVHLISYLIDQISAATHSDSRRPHIPSPIQNEDLNEKALQIKTNATLETEPETAPKDVPKAVSSDFTFDTLVLDLSKATMFIFEAVPLYILALASLEFIPLDIVSKSILTQVAIVVVLQFFISLQLKSIFFVKKKEDLFDQENLKAISIPVALLYCILYFVYLK